MNFPSLINDTDEKYLNDKCDVKCELRATQKGGYCAAVDRQQQMAIENSDHVSTL